MLHKYLKIARNKALGEIQVWIGKSINQNRILLSIIQLYGK